MNPRPGDLPSPPPSPPRPLPVWTLAVAGAALLAHGGCLRAVFYLDDWTHIVQNDSVIDGTWYDYRLRSLTYLVYVLTYRLAGPSAMAFHAGNLLLHVGVSLALLGFARDFLTDAAGLPPARARRVGGWAALLFAVHPLCSETTNYARANDIGLVGLFALLAAWAVLLWRRGNPLGWRDAALAAVSWRHAPPEQARRRRWLGAGLAALVAATFSKEIGLPVAAATATLVGFALPRVGGDPAPRAANRRWLAFVALAGAGPGLLAVVAGTQIAGPLRAATRSFGDPQRLGWFLLTEARIFWMYGARVALPVGLCSDHQIAWTHSAQDRTAWIAAFAQAAVCVAALTALCQRRRPAVRAAGALAAVALVDIMHRVFNVTGELMVEYRMYPAMLPICILLAWGLDAAGAWVSTRPSVPPPAVRAAMAALVAACGVLSARRTLDWSSTEALTANVSAQYPRNGRARQELQEADIRAGRWEAVVARQPDIRKALDSAQAYNQSQSLRIYDPDYLTMTRVSSEGNAALGLARLGRRKEAFAQMDWLRAAMNANGVTAHYYWAIFYYNDGLVHAAAGEREVARMDLRDAADLAPEFTFLRRAQRRYETGQPVP